jgi:hypothetical protein
MASQAVGHAGPAAVVAVLKGMAQRVSAGATVTIPQGTQGGVVSVPATPSELRAALTAARSAAPLPTLSSSPAASNPAGFPERGYGCHPLVRGGTTYQAAWCGLHLKLNGEYCDPNGCTITDKLDTRLTTNPGTNGSMVSWSSTYSYQSGNPQFSSIHVEWFVLCYAGESECGSGNSPDFYGNSTGKFYPKQDSGINLHGDKITHAYSLWAYFKPWGYAISDSAKTGTATCDKTDNECLYP